MKKIIVTLGLLGGAMFLGSMPAIGNDCPTGTYTRMGTRCVGTTKDGRVMIRNAQGQSVPVRPSTTYAQCVQNGRHLGYGPAQIETYCHEKYAR